MANVKEEVLRAIEGLPDSATAEEVFAELQRAFPSDWTDWFRAAARNAAFEFLNDPGEDIYSLTDGVPFHEERQDGEEERRGALGKEAVRQMVQRLSDSASIEDVMEGAYVLAKIERGEREIREGKGIPHEVARERILRKWVK